MYSLNETHKGFFILNVKQNWQIYRDLDIEDFKESIFEILPEVKEYLYYKYGEMDKHGKARKFVIDTPAGMITFLNK